MYRAWSHLQFLSLGWSQRICSSKQTPRYSLKTSLGDALYYTSVRGENITSVLESHRQPGKKRAESVVSFREGKKVWGLTVPLTDSSGMCAVLMAPRVGFFLVSSHQYTETLDVKMNTA